MAHQIIDTGTTTMRDLALSAIADVEACEYPDSRKVLIVTGQRGERGLRKRFRAESTVDYDAARRTIGLPTAEPSDARRWTAVRRLG